MLLYSADEYSREPSSFEPSAEGDEQPIEPISDIGINQINDLMFNDQKWQSTLRCTHDAPVSYYSPWERGRDIEELSFSRSRTVQSERKQLKYILCD